jgi:hypothetical protein
MFSVPLPPRPTAGFRLPHTAPIAIHRPTGTAHRSTATPVCRFSFRWSQELLH